MAGHSKWANIKHRKEKKDAKKGKIFSQIAKEIIIAVKLGGPDPKTNTRLRLAILKAKDANMPNENVERNIKKASSVDAANYEEITYELYGHGGVGIICEVTTDNKNRISSDFRIATNKRGGNVAAPGSVSYQFDRKGIIQVSKKDVKEDTLFAAALDAGADDVEEDEDVFLVTTPPDLLYQVKEALTQKGISCLECAIEMIPQHLTECDPETKQKNLALIEWLENLDDVDSLYHNMKLD